MKNLLLLLSLFVFGASFAQTTADDWQKADCDGNLYGLYDMCDSGKIVVMEFVMMNCSPCVTAANLMKGAIQEIEQTHPGKVEIFSISFNNTTTCNALRAWKTNAGCTWPVITNGKEILDYFGGMMAMPTVVVVGGADKKVIFNSLDVSDGGAGFVQADVAAFKSAITSALTQSSVKVDAAKSAFYTLYPNPATNLLRIETTSDMPRSFEIIDAVGKVMLSGTITGNEINTSLLANGSYSVVLMLADGVQVSKQFNIIR